MKNQFIEPAGTEELPKNISQSSIINQFSRAGIIINKALSRRMETADSLNSAEKKTIYAQKVVADSIGERDIAKSLNKIFSSLSYSDILNCFKNMRLKDNGARTSFLVKGAYDNFGYVQLYKSRHSGWNAELVANPDFMYGELIFGGMK